MGFGLPQDPDDDGRDDDQTPGKDGTNGPGGDGPTDPADLLGSLLGGTGGMGPGDIAGLTEALNAAGMGGFDPQTLGAALAQVQQMLAGGDQGPVNWTLATDVARRTAAGAEVVGMMAPGATPPPPAPTGEDPVPGDAERRHVDEALRLADLWLATGTELGQAPSSAQAWSRAEWVERTLPVWRELVEPVAASVARAMSEAMTSQAPPEMASMLAAAGQMVQQVGGGIFGLQVGQAIGGLARQVLSTSDVGLPLAPAGTVALLPTNIAEFSEGLEVPTEEIRLYLALREVAHHRLVSGVPWLRAHLLATVAAYARGITIDTAKIEDALGTIDPMTDPESVQQALSDGLFDPKRSPAQQRALDQLETALALVEGWVDEVVDAAAREHLPHAAALRETMRRRRASGGPAEHAFAALVGLELRPRRLREAATLWSALLAARGPAGRDAVWDHPDLLPEPADLDDPEGFAVRRTDADAAGADVDAALAALLDDTTGDRPSETGPVGDGDGDEGPGRPGA